MGVYNIIHVRHKHIYNDGFKYIIFYSYCAIYELTLACATGLLGVALLERLKHTLLGNESGLCKALALLGGELLLAGYDASVLVQHEEPLCATSGSHLRRSVHYLTARAVAGHCSKSVSGHVYYPNILFVDVGNGYVNA